MNPQSSASFENRRKKTLLIVAGVVPVVIIIAVIGVIVVLGSFRPHAKTDAAAQTKCLGRDFALGSSGDCVKDIQTMINFMETSGLTECPFVGGSPLSMNDYFGPEVEQQVGVIQDWLTCYNKQEGLNAPDFAKGRVTRPTWSELCTYAYYYPTQNSTSKSSYRAGSLAAGKDAGCDMLAK